MTGPDPTLARLAALRRGDLAGTRELRLPGGAEFPREILGLAETLEILDLGNGPLDRLPDDLGRLTRLRVLFCSGTRFSRLPPVLGDCPALSQVGFRGTGLREVPGEALPPLLRWLTLTDNRIETLPAAIGQRPLLRKLMLAGNRLSALPDTLAGASNLELLRLSANRFDRLPAWIDTLPRLAWLSFAGNSFDVGSMPGLVREVPWDELALGERLGEGASGWIHRADWREDGTGPATAVALKLFKGAITSDGLPEREMAACLRAGAHPNLTGALGRTCDRAEGRHGLLMPLLPAHWRVLAGPPSLESCSRDVYDPALRLEPDVAVAIAAGVAAGAAHLHARGLVHGDLYAHNVLWDGAAGRAVLGDFGAAGLLPPDVGDHPWTAFDVRAYGLLLGELLDRCAGDPPGLRDLERACTQPDPAARPPMDAVAAALAGARA
ncbi:leucine-rich repeat-containing protein kinase family protein [Methylobacterium sp. Leaf108]|uniref:leucine-rich repeat-containing protein kinase family protein n=1 Tax=Methylobacterium sp. Leaf108 TaxID=1736256 RepID=UPI0006F53E11|nr:leucine-rich repeat-containing protein kinase family protein [Methylobacterium sp. Leaf108]KQP61481.1 protein kinase [Methylobacterium sp. Leaf108]